MKVLLIQNMPGLDKTNNLNQILDLIPNQPFDLLVLPESFSSPYGIKYFKEYSESIKDGGETLKFLEDLSNKYPNAYIVGGSIPEKNNEKYFNTCTVWNSGNIVAIYRKIHLFDVNFKETDFSFQESSVLSPGNNPVTFITPWGKIGLGICFDLRFNKLSNYYKENDCNFIIYPGNFTEFSGKLHWELLLRSRAVDNQCYVIGCSSALNNKVEYKSFGNSLISDPWGKILLKFDNKINVSVIDVNLDEINNMRNSIPLNNIL